MDLEKHAEAVTAAGEAYLLALREAAAASKIGMLARMADDFERQHVAWVPKRLASAAPAEAVSEGA
ncbi:hypothetical protein FHP25_31320 [Vineibacter terrae]|uniref:Uncharacterized protein n=1 Tax=Vineibacter terrae TaxID=2586908 RepID=A0A5C8PCW8_9HYPH|nr:hypothetical protein [Vineibacter terrae]TXL71201.1 hypothetical protein FHP25_31320 [Vineibacter terrae]